MARADAASFYFPFFMGFWIFSTPCVAAILGLYLYLCVTVLPLHFDEAFSAMQHKHNKGFLRIQVTEEGTLRIYSLGLPQTPENWKEVRTHAPCLLLATFTPSRRCPEPALKPPLSIPLPELMLPSSTILSSPLYNLHRTQSSGALSAGATAWTAPGTASSPPAGFPPARARCSTTPSGTRSCTPCCSGL